jgi:hypothetical protein
LPQITPQQVALGVGVAGALVDVSSYITGMEGVSYVWGRQNEFTDVQPGSFSFWLDNYDGRFTPDNTASPLVTTVTEGMAVSWNLGGRLVAGIISGIAFPSDEPNQGRIQIMCVTQLITAARRSLGALGESAVLGSAPYLYWPLSDLVGATIAAEISGNGQPSLSYSTNFVGQIPAPTFGITGVPAVGGATQMQITTNVSTIGFETDPNNAKFGTIPYATNSMGFWGVWVTPTVLPSVLQISFAPAGLLSSIQFGIFSGRFFAQAGNASPVYASTPPVAGVPHYVAIGITTISTTSITVTLYLDGTSQGSVVYTDTLNLGPVGVTTNASRTPTIVQIVIGDGTNPSTVNLSHFSHTSVLVHEEAAGVTTEANRIVAIVQCAPELTLGALPSDLSIAPLAIAATSNKTVLDALNDVMRTEQGQVYVTTTGTLLSPATTVSIRARQRPVTPRFIFDSYLELANVVPFIRDITNMVSRVTATSPSTVATIVDLTLVPRVGSATASETVLNSVVSDLTLWGQDRIVRGKNTRLRVTSILIDAMTTPTDRSTDLLGLVPGDRIRVSGLPAVTLGFTTWDGWLLGVTETHTPTAHTFELFLASAIPEAIYDTNLFMSGGGLSLTAGITNSATSISVATSDGSLLETVAVPYTLLIDNEQVSVTACTTGTPQVATITRAANGSSAIGHSSGALVDSYPAALIAF